MQYVLCTMYTRGSVAVAVGTLTAEHTRNLIKINWSAKWKRLMEVVLESMLMNGVGTTFIILPVPWAIVLATVCSKQYRQSVGSSSYCKAGTLELCFDLDFSATYALFLILWSIFCYCYCHYRHHLGSLAHSNSRKITV